jgi:CRP-like cAMP-binding protein
MEKKTVDFPAMDTLTPEQVERINNNSFVVSHSKGEEIFSQDKPISYLMYINSGLVKLYKNDQKHRSIILRLIGPGSYAGLFSAFYDNRYKFSATALEASEMVYISISLINEIILENGRFSMSIIRHLSNDGMDIMDKLIYFPQKQVPGRIAEVLLQFALIYKNTQFTLPLSRQELADYVYSTKESVSRTLTEFKNDRMININDRAITLQSMDLLKILSKLG